MKNKRIQSKVCINRAIRPYIPNWAVQIDDCVLAAIGIPARHDDSPSEDRSADRRGLCLSRRAERAHAAARGGSAVPAQLALHYRDRRLARFRAAGLHAELFQLERFCHSAARHASVRAVRHQPLLSPAADPPRAEMSEMAGAHDGGHRGLLRAGNPGALGRDPPPASSIRRPAAGPAQPAGKFLLEPYRLDPGASAGIVAAWNLRTLRQGHFARPFLRRAGTSSRPDLDQSSADAAVLRRRIFRRAGYRAKRRKPRRRPASAS